MNIKELVVLQTQRGSTGGFGVDTGKRDINSVITECRKAIESKADTYRNLSTDKKIDRIKSIISEYVMHNKPLVDGYIDGENNPDISKLIDKLNNEITDYGILTRAMIDEDVFEIRCNGREIKVERNGKVIDLTDDNNNIVSFESLEQQDIIMKKLLGDTRLTPKDCLISTSTIEGFRIAAVHYTGMSVDPDNPTGERFHAFVLRKFHKTKMGLPDIVKYRTMSDNMARLLAIAPNGRLTFFTVGPTASGKTTTNNAILKHIAPGIRVVLAQNPSEIDIRQKDSSGRVINDVLHLEAVEKENPTPSDPTMSNIMDHILRLSPTVVIFGEIRSNKEFKQAMKIMQAGHPINTTFHAESSAGAIRRFETAYLAESGNEPAHLALSNIVDLVNLIIVQHILPDGSRRVLQISEVIGIDENDKEKPKLNDLYRYEINEEPVYDSDGNVKEIRGVHKRVGKLSERTIEKFKRCGVPTSRFDFLLKDLDESEVETYTGKDIEHYGLKQFKSA